MLAVEGGDPVTGQLGTFTWGDGGSDSPWLPGAPIAVGTGEQLTVTIGDGVGVATWSARRVPAGTTDGSGAVGLGTDGPPIAFGAPETGSWSVQVDGRLRRRTRLGVVLLARHRAMSAGIGVAHLPRRCFPRSGHTAPRAASVAFGPPRWSWSASRPSVRARTGHRRPKRRPTACSLSSRTQTARRSSAGTTPARNRSRSHSPRATRPGSPPGWRASLPRPWPMARWRRATRSISASGSSGVPSSRSARPATRTWSGHIRDVGPRGRSVRDAQRRPTGRR